jgi:hypothetical protein
MVKALLIAATLVGAGGCIIRASGARDATLPYHPTFEELNEAPPISTAAPRPARTTRAKIVVDGFARAYPLPIGLAYSGTGSSRSVTGLVVDNGSLEHAVASGVGARVVGSDDGEEAHIGGGIVEHAQYRFGGTTYASAMVELRVTRRGTEVYAARYRTMVKGGDRIESQLAANLVDQIGGDDRLFNALEMTP